MNRVLERVNGVARCPYDPRHNSTAVVTESGELYAATVIDFSGRDPVIYRSMGGMPPLRTAQYNSKWLNGTTQPPPAQNTAPHNCSRPSSAGSAGHADFGVRSPAELD